LTTGLNCWRSLYATHGTKNESHPLKWLKPLEVVQEKTKYTSNPISDAQDMTPNIIGGTLAILEQIQHQENSP